MPARDRMKIVRDMVATEQGGEFPVGRQQTLLLAAGEIEERSLVRLGALHYEKRIATMTTVASIRAKDFPKMPGLVETPQAETTAGCVDRRAERPSKGKFLRML